MKLGQMLAGQPVASFAGRWPPILRWSAANSTGVR